MSLVRGFSPAQFRDSFLGVIGPVPVSATIPSTAAGALTHVEVTVPGVQVGDIVLGIVPAVTPTVGTVIDGSVTAANTVTVQTSCATGGTTYTPGAQVLTFLLLRAKLS
jgi:uncharacterized protein (DUF697 family)